MDAAGVGMGMSTGLEPVSVTVKRYECPFCSRRRAAKKATADHMGRCWHNPAVRSCKTCANLTEEAAGESCFPSEPCNCNDGYRLCGAGQPIDHRDAVFPMTGCPLWKRRETEEAASA